MTNLTYAIGENFAVKNKISSGSSKLLSNYKPIYEATIVTKLKAAGTTLKRQTKTDEFEIANITTSEAALAVANNEVTFAIGTDANGATRKSALEAKVIGFKPTYGLISRFGMYPIASALDTVGIYAQTVDQIALVTSLLKGLDTNDMNTWDSKDLDFTNLTNNKSAKLFYLDSLSNDAIKHLKGIKVETINPHLVEALMPIHNCLMSAELTTTLANLTGIPFGPTAEGKDADEMTINYRSNLTSEVKTHLIMGTYALTKDNLAPFYYNSLRLRGLLFEELNHLFEEYDALITPNDKPARLIANLCGYPSIAINGLLITGKQKSDTLVLAIAKSLEKGGA